MLLSCLCSSVLCLCFGSTVFSHTHTHTSWFIWKWGENKLLPVLNLLVTAFPHCLSCMKVRWNISSRHKGRGKTLGCQDSNVWCHPEYIQVLRRGMSPKSPLLNFRNSTQLPLFRRTQKHKVSNPKGKIYVKDSLGDLKCIHNLKRESCKGELCEQSLTGLLTLAAVLPLGWQGAIP